MSCPWSADLMVKLLIPEGPVGVHVEVDVQHVKSVCHNQARSFRRNSDIRARAEVGTLAADSPRASSVIARTYSGRLGRGGGDRYGLASSCAEANCDGMSNYRPAS